MQSIFLLLASLCSWALLALPFATTDQAMTQSELFADSSYSVWDEYALTTIFVAVGVIFLATIFFFGNRKLQMRLSMAALYMVIAGAGLAIFYFLQDSAQAAAEPGIGIGLPVLSLIFAFLSYRYIKKDENLVKSMDRLR